MNIQVRYYEKTDYQTLCKFFDLSDEWDHWDPKQISPYSFVAELDGRPVAFSSYYKFEGCPSGLMGFTIADPTLEKEQRRPAVDALLEHLFKHSEENGVDLMYYATDEASAPMIKRFCDFGGVVVDDGTATIAIRSKDNFDYLRY